MRNPKIKDVIQKKILTMSPGSTMNIDPEHGHVVKVVVAGDESVAVSSFVNVSLGRTAHLRCETFNVPNVSVRFLSFPVCSLILHHRSSDNLSEV